MGIDKLVFSENLRFLLWRSGHDRIDWSGRISGWLGAEVQRARALLDDAEPSPHEIQLLADRLGVTQSDLRFSSLLAESGVDLFVENLRYLLSARGRGKKKKLAAHLGVHQTTISRWLSGSQRPEARKLDEIARCFSVERKQLLDNALFLSLIPITDDDRRKWLQRVASEIEPDQLMRMFPALQRILGE